MIFCQPHFERAKKEVPAYKIIDGTPMCRACFTGRPIGRETPLLSPEYLKRDRERQRKFRRMHRSLVRRRARNFNRQYRRMDRETAVY
jgi:hypothetical protein